MIRLFFLLNRKYDTIKAIDAAREKEFVTWTGTTDVVEAPASAKES